MSRAQPPRLQDIFEVYDRRHGGHGYIPFSAADEALTHIGLDTSHAMPILRALDPDGPGAINMEHFAQLAAACSAPPSAPESERGSSAPSMPYPGSEEGSGAGSADAGSESRLEEDGDPKVFEFIRVLEEYRLQSEADGAYEEAARAHDQLKALRKQEETRRVRALKQRHISEREEITAAHASQFSEFHIAWDRYIAEFDAMASMYTGQMQAKHAEAIAVFQEGCQDELSRRHAKGSRELMDWRQREQLLARQRKYAEAQRIKQLADALEVKEAGKVEEERLATFATREAKLRAQHGTEIGALIKRIEARRSEHLKQRELDTRRLLQRNKNIMGVLESRQLSEEQRKSAEIKVALAAPRAAPSKLEPIDTGRRRAIADSFDAGTSHGGSPPHTGSAAHFQSRHGVGGSGSSTVSPTGSKAGTVTSAAAAASVYGRSTGVLPPRAGGGNRGSVAGSVYSQQQPGSARGGPPERRPVGGSGGGSLRAGPASGSRAR